MTLSDKNSDRLNLPTAALAFHKIQSKISYGVTNYSPDRFFQLLDILLENGYKYYNQNSDDKTILITFDDGYKHLKDTLLKLIENYNTKPILFIPTLYIGETNSWDYSHIADKVEHFDKSDIQELSQAGVIIGSHTHSHKSLTSINDSEMNNELTKSKNILEDITGSAITTLSYPFGHFNQKIGERVKEAGYSNAFTMRFPFSNDTDFNRGRFAVYSFDSPKAVLRKIKYDPLEKMKAALANKLSTGTVILNKLRGK